MGEVVGIWIAPSGGAPMVEASSVAAVAGRGLEGDRYFLETGSYSDKPGPSREITLIEQEAIDAIAAEDDIRLQPGSSRRNVVTRGVPLNHLVGSEFMVGDVRCLGIRLCEPCNDLSKSLGISIVQPLLHRGGLRAQILESGTLKRGASIEF